MTEEEQPTSVEVRGAPATSLETPARKRRLTPLRVTLLVVLLVLGAGAWSAYSAYRAQAELRAADAAYDDLSRAFAVGDRDARDAALAEFREQAQAVHDRTDGAWWGLMTQAPGVGVDLAGVERLAAAFDVVADDGVEPLFQVVDAVADQGIVADQQVDLELVASFEDPVSRARAAFAAAGEELAGGDADLLTPELRDPYRTQGAQFATLERALSTAATATRVLPRMLGADEPRDYLLVLQDNATIRPSGGRPVSWARVRADGGRLSVEDQGGPDDFPAASAAGLTPDELELYGPSMARDFADAGLTPDFPRVAELWAGHYADLEPRVELDGVVAVDPVALSALLGVVGPAEVSGLALNRGNVVAVLSSEAHLRLDAAAQDDAYAQATRALLGVVLGGDGDPQKLLLALAEATDQGRLLLAPFDETDAADLEGSAVLGRLAGDDGATPHVDVTLADDTGGAMSYYLRRQTSVVATSCDGDRQRLSGTLTLDGGIARAEAAALPDTVTGGGREGVRVGDQALVVRLYAPYQGSVDTLSVDGEPQEVALFGGDERPTAALRVVLSGREPVTVTWTMTTGPGQDGRGEYAVTPGTAPGPRTSTFLSAC